MQATEIKTDVIYVVEEPPPLDEAEMVLKRVRPLESEAEAFVATGEGKTVIEVQLPEKKSKYETCIDRLIRWYAAKYPQPHPDLTQVVASGYFSNLTRRRPRYYAETRPEAVDILHESVLLRSKEEVVFEVCQLLRRPVANGSFNPSLRHRFGIPLSKQYRVKEVSMFGCLPRYALRSVPKKRPKSSAEKTQEREQRRIKNGRIAIAELRSMLNNASQPVYDAMQQEIESLVEKRDPESAFFEGASAGAYSGFKADIKNRLYYDIKAVANPDIANAADIAYATEKLKLAHTMACRLRASKGVKESFTPWVQQNAPLLLGLMRRGDNESLNLVASVCDFMEYGRCKGAAALRRRLNETIALKEQTDDQ